MALVVQRSVQARGSAGRDHRVLQELELELIQPQMAQKPVLRGEVGCACVAREVSVERRGMLQGLSRVRPSCASKKNKPQVSNKRSVKARGSAGRDHRALKKKPSR